ncbi:SGNH/GDSL hydrolase family protein [Streptomyces virginiae]|uniref:SGNH/GDSL hydrolase family protein n=1 Tax=Streptomyces virginiae TaxID=1961 RepID=UPI0036597FD1
MSFPVGTPTVTLVGTIPSAVAGTAYRGKLVCKPSAYLVDAGRNAVYPGGGSVAIASDGTFSVVLLPCDASGVEPVGWRWFLDLQPTGGTRIQFYANITGTGTVQFSDLTPVPAPNGGPSTGEGSGAVASVNGQTGVVVLDAEDVDADPEGTAAAAVTAHTGASDPHGDRAAAAAALAAHEADTTSVHGITNTAVLETQSGAQSKADTAQAAAVSTAAADATSKVTTHTGATDPHGDRAWAAGQFDAAGAAAAAQTAAATDAAGKVSAHTVASDPHGDRADAATKYLGKTANLSDLSSASSARTNLGLGGAATLSVGTTAGTVAAGDDSRFSAIGSAGPQGLAGADGAGIRTAEARITDGASTPADLTSSTPWIIATSSVGTPLQCSIPAAVGDRIRVHMSMMYVGAHFMDLALLNSAGAIDQYGASGTGTPLAEGAPELYPSVSFSKTASGGMFAVTSAHITSAGMATIALAHSGTSSGKVYSNATYPWRMLLENLGPAPAPTSISVAQTGTATSGYVKYAPAGVALTGSDVTAPFRYLGATGFQIGSGTPDSSNVLPISRYPNTRGTLSSSQSVWSVEFGTDAAVLQLRFNYQTAGMYRLWVDGRRYTDLMLPVGGTTPGSTHLMTISLGIAQARTVRLDFYTVPFGGVHLPPGATVWSTSARANRFMVFGDSLSDGSSMNTGGGGGTWAHKAARLLGYDDYWNESRGGTGYITSGSFTTLANRVAADVVANVPTKLIVWAGYNDNAGSQPSIGTAAASLYSTIQAGLPDCDVIVLGCWSPTGSPGSTLTNTDATLKTAAAAAGLPFVSPITGSIYNAAGALVATHGAWITGTGRVGATTGTGNADTYIGTDAVHPTDAGHRYLADRVVAAIQELASI